MRDSIAIEPALGPSADLGHRLARQFVLRLGAHIRHGRIVVRDPLGTVEFGRETEELPLSVNVTVHDLRLWSVLALSGSIGAGEAWVEELYDTGDLVGLVRILVRNRAAMQRLDGPLSQLTQPLHRAFHKLRRNTPGGARENIAAHYDLGNALYATFLDETMSYSAGIFETPESSLFDASRAKNERVCDKLGLGPSDHVLEIGSGWGGLALHMASRYGCRVTTVTLSQEQRAFVEKKIADQGLSSRVSVELRDYRSVQGRFDKIVSIEMIEAVGHEYLPVFFEKLGALLQPDGVAVLQSITIRDQQFDASKNAVDFIKRYIFPGSCIPSITALLGAATRASDLTLTHLEDITPHYALTLRHWRERFVANAGEVERLGYDRSFRRLWEFYLAYCEAGFRERYIGDVQLVFAKPGFGLGA
ncbi:MAG: class I SAM-dependent methyltransferase [Myxococcales bacterium]|nr:class I SAM-dependent methyltransferase [Myxococcales bacterium]MCB9577089.1 class I SAM-dependent methyltransferase [Polyangiaceae bacterium]